MNQILSRLTFGLPSRFWLTKDNSETYGRSDGPRLPLSSPRANTDRREATRSRDMFEVFLGASSNSPRLEVRWDIDSTRTAPVNEDPGKPERALR